MILQLIILKRLNDQTYKQENFIEWNLVYMGILINNSNKYGIKVIH
jgi:hypothetical protein